MNAESSSNKKDAKMSKKKKLKINVLFQVMVYILKNGLVKTSFHILNGLSVHFASRSKSLIESLNHMGRISYDEILRAKTNLSSYTLEMCEKNIPLPSHFDKSLFTTAAFDNFDHNDATESGLNSTHDTVSVLFQDDSNKRTLKPKISETQVDKRKRTLDKNLECQQLKDFNKPSDKIIINSEAISIDFISPENFKVTRNNDLLWFLSRMNVAKFSGVDDEIKSQQIPT